ncbi:MAG TPA: SDR family NAD(P)-dependent oxidoreductase, partial [Ignavibacteriaceae bacterium]|nr:SDR family NAD(P)-dependent oxidoreductase [Ignavibacteriaceae bacterium]
FTEKRIFIITGADSGIGKAACKYLSQLDITLIMVVRNHVRGERALREIEKNSNADLHLFLADLSSQESIRILAKKIREKFKKIDVLINNAGARFSKRHLTIDGIEATFAVNYLSRFLLTNLLLDLLKESSHARIINVSGEYHRKGKIHFDDLALKENYTSAAASAQAKLADILFTYSLAEKLKNTDITVNCLHPGAAATNIVYSDPDAGLGIKFLYAFSSLFLSSPEKGAETIIYLAADKNAAGITGKYFINKKPVESSEASHDKKLAERLWEVSEKLILSAEEQENPLQIR